MSNVQNLILTGSNAISGTPIDFVASPRNTEYRVDDLGSVILRRGHQKTRWAYG